MINYDEKNREDSFTPDEMKKAVWSGTRAVIIAQIASQIISLGVLAALYRLVEPEGFGLLGMAAPLVLLSRMLATFGLNVAAVQHRKLSDRQFSSLFWIHLALSAATTILTAVLGVVLAKWYQAPELAPVCAALAATTIVAALGAQHQAMLERKLQIGRLSVARLLGQAAGGAAGVAAALLGAGIWSLVLQQFVELLTINVALWTIEPWRPCPPLRGESVRELLRFGGYYWLSSLMFYVAVNADKIFLSVMLGSSQSGRIALAMYIQAFNLMMRPVYLATSPILSVMLPALSCSRGDRPAYAKLTTNFFRIVGIALLPCGVGLYFVASDAMQVLGGDKWRGAGEILTVLAPVIMVQGFINIAGSVFSSVGRADRLFYGSAVFALLLVQGYLVGYYLGGMADPTPMGAALGVAWSYTAVSAVVLFAPYMLYCFYVVRIKPRDIFQPLLRPLAAALIMGAAVWSLQIILTSFAELSQVMRLGLLIVAGAVIYFAVARKELRWLFENLRRSPEDESSSPLQE